jgi:hypothetical protein
MFAWLPWQCARRGPGALRMVNAEQLGLRNKDPEFQFFDQAQVGAVLESEEGAVCSGWSTHRQMDIGL